MRPLTNIKWMDGPGRNIKLKHKYTSVHALNHHHLASFSHVVIVFALFVFFKKNWGSN